MEKQSGREQEKTRKPAIEKGKKLNVYVYRRSRERKNFLVPIFFARKCCEFFLYYHHHSILLFVLAFFMQNAVATIYSMKSIKSVRWRKKRRKRIVHFPLLGVGVCLRGLRVFVCLEAAVKILIVQLIRCVEERRPAAHSNFNRNAQKRYAKISAINSRTILYITQRKSFFYISSLFEYFFFLSFFFRFGFGLHWLHSILRIENHLSSIEWNDIEMKCCMGKLRNGKLKWKWTKATSSSPQLLITIAIDNASRASNAH